VWLIMGNLNADKKVKNKRLLFGIALLCTHVINAAPVYPDKDPTTTITCVVATEREDNTLFDWKTEGGGVRFYYGYESGNYPFQVDRPGCSWDIDNTKHVGKTVYIVATNFDSDNRESGFSNQVVHEVGLSMAGCVSAARDQYRAARLNYIEQVKSCRTR